MSKQAHVESWRRRTRQKLMYAFGSECGICGYSRCDKALHLHHLNPLEKEFAIGSALKNNISWDRLVNEAKKCVLLCSNCHMEVHDGLAEIPDDIKRYDQKLLLEDDMYDFCPDCGKRKPIHFEYCSRMCAGRNNAKHVKIEWEKIDVHRMYKDLKSYAAVAREIGCSPASVRKRMIKIGK